MLGNNVFVGPNATLLEYKFPPSGTKQLWQPVIVNDGAVIGGGLPGCNVGANAVLGAGAVLTNTFQTTKFGQVTLLAFDD